MTAAGSAPATATALQLLLLLATVARQADGQQCSTDPAASNYDPAGTDRCGIVPAAGPEATGSATMAGVRVVGRLDR